MIEAKPVIDKKYWILKRDNQKVGALEAADDGYTMRLLDQIGKFKTIPMVRKKLDIDNVLTQSVWGCEAVSMHDVVSQHTNLRHTMTLICVLL